MFSCYDLKKDCFVDFTGCGEYKQLYSYKMTDREGNVWLWQDGNGCRKVTYMNGGFTSIVLQERKLIISLLIMLLIYLRMNKEEYGLVAMTV